MVNNKLKIAVLVGGPSFEHEVSLSTGKEVLKNLDPSKYKAKRVLIDKKGKWEVPPEKIKKQFDLCFIAMHGEYGEDGIIQGLLEAYRIPYTCSGIMASAVGMDKLKSAELFELAGFNIPKTFLINSRTPQKEIHKIIKKLGLPFVVKPRHVGSSVGISIVKSKKGITKALKDALKTDPDVLIQKYIRGREVTCGILDFGTLDSAFPLIPTEIIPKDIFFTYKAKYTPGASDEITPAQMPSKILKEVQKLSLLAHKTIGCSGMSRTDFIFACPPSLRSGVSRRDGKKLWVLEINTIPGLTPTSLVPQEARAMGINFSELLDIIIKAAKNRFRISK